MKRIECRLCKKTHYKFEWRNISDSTHQCYICLETANKLIAPSCGHPVCQICFKTLNKQNDKKSQLAGQPIENEHLRAQQRKLELEYLLNTGIQSAPLRELCIHCNTCARLLKEKDWFKLYDTSSKCSKISENIMVSRCGHPVCKKCFELRVAKRREKKIM